MTDLGRAERHALEIEALGNEILTRIPGTIRAMRDYKRGYPTGHAGRTDLEAGACTRTEALALAGPDAIDREQRELTDCLDRALRALQTAYNICARYKPTKQERERLAKAAIAATASAQSGDLDGWCRSCIRDHSHLEPVWDGRYVDLCRWCAEFRNAEGTDPPVPLLRARHDGRRITTAMVDAELARAGHRRRTSA